MQKAENSSPIIDLSYFSRHPSIEENSSGHSETFHFKKMKAKHRCMLAEEIPADPYNEFLSSFEDITLIRKKIIKDDQNEAPDTDEPLLDQPEIFFYLGKGAAIIGTVNLVNSIKCHKSERVEREGIPTRPKRKIYFSRYR